MDDLLILAVCLVAFHPAVRLQIVSESREVFVSCLRGDHDKSREADITFSVDLSA